MDHEVLLAIIFKKVEERLKAIPSPLRGSRGQRGARGLDGKEFNYQEHEEEFRKLAQENSLKFEDLSTEQIESLRGARGRDGKDGKDFNFQDHEETIKNWSREFALKFEDLSNEQMDRLRGTRGRDGRDGKDGKDFNFEEHEKTIRDWVEEFSLKFEDLTVEQINSLRGPRGRDGKDGANFDFEENRESITEVVHDLISNIKNSLKLKFEDLTAEDIEQLRGPRGRDGRDGKNFEFEEHRDFFQSLKPKFSDFTKEEVSQLTLKFSHLTEEEKSKLKLRFEDLTDEDRVKLKGSRGSRGQRGLPGRDGIDGLNGKDGKSIRGTPGIPGVVGRSGRDGVDGRDGQDGKDAPYISDIRIEQYKQNEIEFVFEFSDGTVIRSDRILLPRPNVFIAASGGGSSSSGGSGSSGITGTALKALALVGVFAAGDTTYTLPQTPLSDDDLLVWLNGAMRTDYTLSTDTVVFVGQDTTGQVFDAQFRYGVATSSSQARKAKALVGIYSAGDTTYTLPEIPVSNEEVIIWLNGIMRTDCTIVDDNVTFVGQDTTGQVFDASYRF